MGANLDFVSFSKSTMAVKQTQTVRDNERTGVEVQMKLPEQYLFEFLHAGDTFQILSCACVFRLGAVI